MASKRAEVLSLARDRHSIVTWPLAREAGMTRSSFDRMVHALGMTQLFEGVHLAPSAPKTPHAVIMAAILASGADAVASHSTALRLWGLFDLDSSSVPDVTLPHTRRVRRIPGVRVHRTRYLPEDWVTEVDGIPVTSPARSLRDIAASVRTRVLRNLVIDAEKRKLVTLDDLRSQLDRRQTAAGATRYRTVVRGRRRDRSDSGFEADVRAVMLEADIEVTPGPEPVECPDGRTLWVDMAVVGTDVVLECDGKAYHDGRRAFARDRLRWNHLDDAGKRLVWVTTDMLDDPDQLVARVRRAIARDQAERRAA